MIGWHHGGYMEQWDASERGDSPRNDNGFMDPFENHHPELAGVMKHENARVAELHHVSK